MGQHRHHPDYDKPLKLCGYVLPATNENTRLVNQEGQKCDYRSLVYIPKASKSERNKGCEDIEEIQTTGGGGLTADFREDGSLETASAGGKYGSIKAKQSNSHPTVKPIALMEYLIKMVTPKGGTVLDPFMGSGTTGVACKKLKRDFIGIELSKEYCNIARKRLEETQKPLL
jgi:DNA modification methylase